MSDEIKLKASFSCNTLLFFCLFFFLLFFTKKNQGQTLWGRIAPALSTKNSGISIISSNISAQKEGIVPKTTHIAYEHL